MRSRRPNWKIIISLVTVIAMLSAMTVMVSAGSTRIDPSESGPIGVEVSKSANVTEVEIGDLVTYTIEIKNLSTQNWATIKIKNWTDSLGFTVGDISWNPVNPATVGIAPQNEDNSYNKTVGTYSYLVTDTNYDPGQKVINNLGNH